MRHEEMDDLVDDTLLNPDYDPEADALPEGGIDELVAFMDEDEDEPADDFGFPDSEVTKRNLIVGEDITKSQPGPMDVHTAVGMFDAKKKKRKKIGKSFDEIFKARAKSGYAPGKNPNSHKRREAGFAPKGHDSLSEWKNTDKGGKKTYMVHPDQFAPPSPKNRIDRRRATANRLASKAASKESNPHKAEMRANSVRDMLNTARQRMVEARAIRDQIKSGQTYGIPISQLKAKMSNNVQQARYFTRGARLETNR